MQNALSNKVVLPNLSVNNDKRVGVGSRVKNIIRTMHNTSIVAGRIMSKTFKSGIQNVENIQINRTKNYIIPGQNV